MVTHFWDIRWLIFKGANPVCVCVCVCAVRVLSCCREEKEFSLHPPELFAETVFNKRLTGEKQTEVY